MLIARRVALGMVVLALMACSQKGLDTRIEFGSRVGAGAELATVKTWNFVPQQNVPTGNPTLDDPANLQRLEDAVASELSTRGMERSMDAPDFVITYQIGVKTKYDDPDWINAYQTEQFHHSDVQTDWQAGNLTIIFFSAATGQAMWAGWGQGELDPTVNQQQARSNLRKVVQRIFEKFDADRKTDAPAAKTDFEQNQE
jgi:hypothetical protein